jgi:hypothetical protein
MRPLVKTRLPLPVIAAIWLLAPVLGFLVSAGGAKLQLADAAPAATQGGPRVIFWTNCDFVVGMSDADLALWRDRGVGGFVCSQGRLWGMGGRNAFDASPGADLSAPEYAFQRWLRDTRIAERARALGLKLYLGVNLVNTYNTSTPLHEWFDDAGWNGEVIPRMRSIAAVAQLYGFDGVAFDSELYAQLGGALTATWEADYPGHEHPADVVRAKAKERGRDLMRALTTAYPGLELVNYWLEFPSSWQAYARQARGIHANAFADSLMPSFWDGISSVRGYSAIRFYDHSFYKTPLIPGATWDAALQYNANAWYSALSREWSSWSYAAPRFHLTPFVWIDDGIDADEAARSSADVAEQLRAARRWSTGGEIANFARRAPSSFDYAPYVPALRAAAGAGVDDTVTPGVRLTSPGTGTIATSAAAITLAGTASDNLAVRLVRWRNDRGGTGTAALRWNIISGDYRTGYRSRMDWTAVRVPLQLGPNRITITARDIKGLSRTVTVVVDRRARP